MTDRERLIEILKLDSCPSPYICDESCKYANLKQCYEERTADLLLEHGVIVPPCKIGDTIYFIDEDMILEGTVKSIESRYYVLAYVSSKRIEFAIPKSVFGESAFLTREEAEKAINPELLK